jgi:DNA-binding XRE family transcriptional regulator
VDAQLSGEELKNWRETQALSQDELGQFLEVSREWIGKLERGEREVSAEIFLRFSRLKGDPRFSAHKKAPSSHQEKSIQHPVAHAIVAESPGAPYRTVASRLPLPSETKPATRADCEEHVRIYLDAAEVDPNGLAYAFKVIRKHLDPADFEAPK